MSKTALVSGGASGLGEACVQRLLEADYQVWVLDCNEEALQNMPPHSNRHDVVSNICDSESVSRALAEIGDLPLHVVLNCAGIATAGRLIGKNGPHDLPLFDQTLQVNLLGSFNVMRLAAAKMQTQAPDDAGNRGVMINTSSVAASDGQLGQTAYAASKAGVAAMTLPAARELAAYGIRVMCIAPGVFQTPMLSDLKPELGDVLVEQMLWPKRLGEGDEFARLVMHIIDNPYLNAEVIRLDAGIRMV